MLNFIDDYALLIEHSFRNVFLIGLILLLLDLFSIIIVRNFFNINLINIFVCVSFFGFLFFNFKSNATKYSKFYFSLKKKYSFFDIFENNQQYLFLFILILIVVSSLGFEQIAFITGPLHDFQFGLFIFALIVGAITFYKNKIIFNEIENNDEKEILLEMKKEKEFNKNFSKLANIPVISKLGKWIYKEGWIYILILIGILFLFTLVKLPYFDVSFTGEHTMKYNSHVEPAKYMYEKGNPFWNQQKYNVDLIERPDGIWKTFGTLPIIEWGLFITFNLFQFNSLEFNTRLFTNFLGLIILLCGYLFFRQLFNKKQSLIITFLLAINPIINFISFVTVEDSLLLIFTFLSLNFLLKFVKTKDNFDLFFAGLFFGLGFLIKYSIGLWLLPIFLIIFWHNFKDKKEFFRNLIIVGVLTFLPTIAFRTSLRYLPSNALFSIILFIIWLIIFYFIFKLVVKKVELIDKYFKFIFGHKLLFFILCLIVILIGIYFIIETQIYFLFNEFFTDSQLIFNYDLYDYMLNNQFKNYLTENIFNLGLVSLFLVSISKFKQKYIILSIFVGALIYWVSASKVIFFHSYYTSIIMVVFSLLVGFLIYVQANFFKNNFIKIFSVFLILLLIFSLSIQENTHRLGEEFEDMENFNLLIDYLDRKLDENDIYIDDIYLLTITLKTGNRRISEYNLDNKIIELSVSNIGFKETLDNYHIKYLITTRDEPRYERYVNLFSDEKLEDVTYRRTDIILEKLKQKDNYFSDISLRTKLINDFSIKEKFILEKEFGRYKIFSFKN